MKKIFLLAVCCWASSMAMQSDGGSIAEKQLNVYKRQKDQSINRWRGFELAAWMLIAGTGSGMAAVNFYKEDKDRWSGAAKVAGIGALGSIVGGVAFLSARDISSAEEWRLKREYAFDKILGYCSQCAHDVLPNMTVREQGLFQKRMADNKYASVLCPEHKKKAETAAAKRAAAIRQFEEPVPDPVADLDYVDVVGSGYNN